MLSFTGNHTQCYTRKDVGIVPLTRYEIMAIRKCDRCKGASTGKHSLSLKKVGHMIRAMSLKSNQPSLNCLRASFMPFSNQSNWRTLYVAFLYMYLIFSCDKKTNNASFVFMKLGILWQYRGYLVCLWHVTVLAVTGIYRCKQRFSQKSKSKLILLYSLILYKDQASWQLNNQKVTQLLFV